MQRRKPWPQETPTDIMSRFLFPRLTTRSKRGSALFQALVEEARQPHWYLLGKVPDTVDGRFAVLATVTAIATVRLEQGSEVAREAAVALTERFIDSMDAEHREMGIGDPSIGKTVRKLVGSLGRRVELWRDALRDSECWPDVAAQSLFVGPAPSDEAAEHCGQHLRLFWARLCTLSGEALAEGRIR
jgi:cytochrome b pre-mRNA-processing protein 3